MSLTQQHTIAQVISSAFLLKAVNLSLKIYFLVCFEGREPAVCLERRLPRPHELTDLVHESQQTPDGASHKTQRGTRPA